MKSNVTLSLDHGLLGSLDIDDYDTGMRRSPEGGAPYLIYAEDALSRISIWA
jgi:hypothetical protein